MVSIKVDITSVLDWWLEWVRIPRNL